MRSRAYVLCVLAAAVACGRSIDTSIEPAPADAGVPAEAGVVPNDAGDAGTSPNDAGDDDDDDDARDAAVSDATADAAPDAPVVTCTTFKETFPVPWSHTTFGWEPEPQAPAFATTSAPPTFVTLQASSIGSPTSAFLTHDVTHDCPAHLRFAFRLSDTSDLADVTVARIASAGPTFDLVRLKSGPLTAVYAGGGHVIGQANALAWNTVDVDIPAMSGDDNVKIFLNGVSTAQPFSLGAMATHVTQLRLGVVAIANPSGSVTVAVDLDDIELNP